jgi:hypothetical protein
MTSLSEALTCSICGGDVTECERVGNHDWAECLTCAAEVRPSWPKCPDCDEPLDATKLIVLERCETCGSTDGSHTNEDCFK